MRKRRVRLALVLSLAAMAIAVPLTVIALASADEMTRPIDSDPIVRVPCLPVIAVTRCGRISSPSFATVDATSPIWSGVTNVSA